jgi:glycosidase
LALGLLATLRGMPQLYSGDEIGMEGGNDPDNRRDFPGGFPGDTRSAFTGAGRTATEQQIFAWTSGMLALRASHPALETGLEQDLFADDDVFAFIRTSGAGSCSYSRSADPSTERLLIIVNKAEQSELLKLPVEGTALAGCTKFQAMAPATGSAPVAAGGKLNIEEPAESITVYEVR